MNNLASMPRDYTKSLQFGGLIRTCYVHLPPGYDGSRAVPLVLALHGMGSDGRGMALLTHFNAIADEGGFIVAYPDGIRKRWSFGPLPMLGGIDDVGFIAALIAALSSDLAIDQARVYALGMSNGGGLVDLLICRRADLFAAVVIVAATIAAFMSHICRPSRPVSVLMIHGTDDPLIPFAGGGRRRQLLLSAPTTAQHWARLAGCVDGPEVHYLPDSAHDGTRVRCEVYSGGPDGAEVILYVIEGGGHTWPGGMAYLPERIIGKTSRQFDASLVIWDFFQRHTRS
ncbi:MAG TPA: PHB depolymerase family esterase [Ktedonobacterales bacterium]|nr:PHB depolymerase family esterase [Ktedonobacterales bacterium]